MQVWTLCLLNRARLCASLCSLVARTCRKSARCLQARLILLPVARCPVKMLFIYIIIFCYAKQRHERTDSQRAALRTLQPCSFDNGFIGHCSQYLQSCRRRGVYSALRVAGKDQNVSQGSVVCQWRDTPTLSLRSRYLLSEWLHWPRLQTVALRPVFSRCTRCFRIEKNRQQEH